MKRTSCAFLSKSMTHRQFDAGFPIFVHSIPLGVPEEIGFLISLLLNRKNIQDDRLHQKHAVSMWAASDGVVRMTMTHYKGFYENVVVLTDKVLTVEHPNVINFSDLKGQKVEYTF